MLIVVQYPEGGRSALDIFEVVAASPEGLRVTEIARQLAIPKSSASNLSRTLAERSQVIRYDRDVGKTLPAYVRRSDERIPKPRVDEND